MKLGLLLVLALLVMVSSLSEGYRRPYRPKRCKAVYIAKRFYFSRPLWQRKLLRQKILYCFKPLATTSAPTITEAITTPSLSTSAVVVARTSAGQTPSAMTTAGTPTPAANSTGQFTSIRTPAAASTTRASPSPLPSTSTGTAEQTPVAIGGSTTSRRDLATFGVAAASGNGNRRRRNVAQPNESDSNHDEEEEFEGVEDILMDGDNEGLEEDYDDVEEDEDEDVDVDDAMTEGETMGSEGGQGREKRGVRRRYRSRKCLQQLRCLIRVIRQF